MLLEMQKFEFGDFLLDAKEKTLFRGDKPVSITPKAFDLLLVLVKNHGHLVEKDKLLKAVWADSFVEESNLSFTVGLLRKALDDDAQKPRFIETVPKRGYRFIAEVKRIEEPENQDTSNSLNDFSTTAKNDAGRVKYPPHLSETKKHSTGAVVALADWRSEAKASSPEQEPANFAFPAQPSETEPSRKTVKSPGRKGKTVAVAIVLLAVAAIALGFYLYGAKKSPVSGKKSIAVLPLKPINTASRNEIYEIGIADSLILRLSAAKNLVVRPLSAVRKYADIEQDPLAAGREQKVDYVLATNYQLANGKVRVTAQFFNVADGQIEETFKGESDAGDVFAMQDAIADEVGNFFLSRLAATTSSHSAEKRGTTNEEAYRLYLQGMYLCDKRNLPDALKAVEVLEQALRIDPNYAQAWAGKAYAHRIIGNHKRSINTHEEYQKSIAAVEKALALNENLHEAYSVLCDNKMYYEYDFDGAEKACRRAIELDPNSSLAHQVYSRFLNSRGRSDEALNEIKTAIDLEPTSYHNQRNLGVSLYFARRFDEAAAQFHRVIATDQDSPSTYMWLSFVLEMQGNNEAELFDCFLKMQEISDQDARKQYQTIFEKSGWQGVLRARLEAFEETNTPYFHGAAIAARIGDKKKAFEYLGKSFERRELWIANLQVDPRLDSLRDDPRFAELTKRVESK